MPELLLQERTTTHCAGISGGTGRTATQSVSTPTNHDHEVVDLPSVSEHAPTRGGVSGGLSWGAVASAAGWLLVKILVIVGIVTVVLTTVFGLVRTPDGSMGPAFHPGDVVLVYRVGSDYALGDVVALDYQGHRQLRRVVARSGDRVDITSDGLVVNGAVQDEPHTVGDTLRVDGGVDYPLVVGEDEIFVLADMREDPSPDSRVYGPVKVADTVGKAMSLLRQDRL